MDPHRKLKVGDVILYSGKGEWIPTNKYVVCHIAQIFGSKRSLKIKTIKESSKKNLRDRVTYSVYWKWMTGILRVL